jgi:hypothetical protein
MNHLCSSNIVVEILIGVCVESLVIGWSWYGILIVEDMKTCSIWGVCGLWY